MQPARPVGNGEHQAAPDSACHGASPRAVEDSATPREEETEGDEEGGGIVVDNTIVCVGCSCERWLSRRCYPILLFATSQLCSVMSMPSEHAWNQAIRVLTWLRDNYKVGITYHSNRNLKPKMFYDSSHSYFRHKAYKSV